MTKVVYNSAYLAERQRKIDQDLSAKRTEISTQWELLVAPPKTGSKMQLWFNQAERAVAIYDGVMTGYKIFQRFNHFFRRTKHNNKSK